MRTRALEAYQFSRLPSGSAFALRFVRDQGAAGSLALCARASGGDSLIRRIKKRDLQFLETFLSEELRFRYQEYYGPGIGREELGEMARAQSALWVVQDALGKPRDESYPDFGAQL